MITIRPLTAQSISDRAGVSRIFREAPGYTELVEGRAPSEDDVDDFFNGKPESKELSDKAGFGLYVGPDMVGCADVIRGYPSDDCAFIGLLLFSEAHQNRRYGRAALGMIDEIAGMWGCGKLRLAVVTKNLRALAFWQREGFAVIHTKTNPRFLGTVTVMERLIRYPPKPRPGALRIT
ncbi:MAG: GNAT family N-acetyltransferase [Janthinobacterium lividum]